MFYDQFVKLCKSQGVSPSKAAVNAGLSKSAVTKWKQNPDSRPTGKALELLSDYFHMPISEILGEPSLRTVSDKDIQFFLFGSSDDITDEMYNEVLSYAAFLKEREQAKKKSAE